MESKEELKVKLILAKLEIVKLRHTNHGYDWSMVDEKGKDILENTLIEIDSILLNLENKNKPKKQLEIIVSIEHFEEFVNREDIDVISVDVKSCEQNMFFQESFIAIVYYSIL